MDLTSLQSELETIDKQTKPSNATELAPSTVVKKKKKVKKGEKGKKKKSTVKLIEPIAIDDSNDETRVRFRRYSMQDFLLLRLLGEGGFGKVYLAKLVGFKAYFAVKFIAKQKIIESNDYESVVMEKKVMIYGNINHFICRLFCSFQTNNYLCLAMEFCCGGDLKFHLFQEKRFPEDKVRFYLAEMLCGIGYLHKHGIIYRDLKLDNVMIAGTGHIKLVDFGLCLGKIYREDMMPSDFCGTTEYMAPEVIKGKKYNQSVDYWSLGIVAYEMSVGTYPFTGTDEEEICWFICNQNTNFPSFLSESLRHLISSLLAKHAEERLGMPGSPHGKIGEHIFFSQIDWQDVEKCALVPPYIPVVTSAYDTRYFAEGSRAKKLTEGVSTGLMQPNNQCFVDFDYTNPNMTD